MMCYTGCGDVTIKGDTLNIYVSITEYEGAPFCLVFKIGTQYAESKVFFSSTFPPNYIDGILRSNDAIELEFDQGSRLVDSLAKQEAEKELAYFVRCFSNPYRAVEIPEMTLRLVRRQLEHYAIRAFRASYERVLDAAIAAEASR